MTIKEKMLQQLYDALNVDTIDLLSNPEFQQTSLMRVHRCHKLASDWIKEIKKKKPDFKLTNRLELRDKPTNNKDKEN